MELFTSGWDACFPPGTADITQAAPPLSCVSIVLQNIINSALVISGVVAVILIMYAGFQYATSNGDKEKVDAARKRITYAIIGLIVIVFAFTFMNVITQLIGVDQSQIGIGE